MNCIASCAVGVGLVASSLYVNISPSANEKVERLKSLLNPEQLAIYELVLAERFNLYVRGLLYGVVLGLIVLFLLGDKKLCLCMVVLTILLTQVFYYLMTPKKHYMLQVLTSKEQVDAWLEVYLTMRYRYMLGFTLGVMGYIAFFYQLT
jgi:hypothetical protein